MGARGTVLLVDDSPLTLEVTRHGLEAAGYPVRIARDLDEFEQARGDRDIVLMLLDVEMAEAFGDDLAALLRDGGAQMPIYLLSALAEPELAARAREAGADGYLCKREGVAAVVRKVNEALGRASAHREPGGEFRSRFVQTARLRVAQSRAGLAAGGPDGLRRAAFELHALIGEASILGFDAIAELARRGRASAELADPADAAIRCAHMLTDLERRIETVEREDPATAGTGITVAGPRGGDRIMLVDDSELYRATLRAILEDAGHVVTEAASLAECRALLQSTGWDLAVLDVELGDGDGTSLISDLRAREPWAPVVMMTGGDAPVLPEGADLVLLKTLDPTTVLVKLERLLAERRAG